MERPRELTVLAAVVVFVLTAIYRFNLLGGHLGGFENDEYLVISRAAAMLRGDLPSRDFVDPGYPLAYVASALSLGASNGTLLGHALLTVTMLALGAALTCVVAITASGSIAIGLLAATVQVFLGPRLYNYPKLILYALAVLAWWSYVARPASVKLVALAVLTAVAFLFRHDHGAYIALGTGVMLALLARNVGLPQTVRNAVTYGIAVVVCLAPYAMYLQRHGGIVDHLRVGAEFSRVDRDRTQLRWPVFTIDWNAPLVHVAPPGGEARPRPKESWWSALRREVPLLRASIAPGVLRPENAAPFVYYLWLAIPPAAIFVLAAGVRRWHDAGAWADVARIAPVITVGLVLNAWFLRGTLPVRLADVSVLMAALGAWLVMRTAKRDLWSSGLARTTYLVLLVLVAGVTLASAASVGVVGRNLRTVSDDAGFSGVLSRARKVAAELDRSGPRIALQRAADSSGMRASHYLNSCLGPEDRAFVTGYRPEVFYFANRGFAGGQVDLRAGYLSGEQDQRLAIERMRAQSVPVVLTEARAVFEERYRPESPILAAYFDEAYREAAEKDFSGEVFRVLVHRESRPTGTYAPLGLPCFR